MNNLILIGNSILYIGTFSIYQYKVKKITLASVVLMLYSLLSVASIGLYNTDVVLNYKYQNMSVFPFIYLYLSLMLIFIPLLKIKETSFANLKIKHTGFITALSVLTIIVSMVILIPRITSISLSNLINPEAMSDAYFENRLDVSKRIGFGIMNLIGFLTGLLRNMSMLLLVYNILYIKKKALIIGLFAIVIFHILYEASMGHRGLFMSIFFDVLFVFLCFRQNLSKKIKRKIMGVLGVLMLLISVFFMTITIGRSEVANTDAKTFVLDYIGQPFLNFNKYGLDVGGTREGDRTFPLVKVLLGMPTASNFMERRDIYHYLKVDDSIFSTFVGDFTIDYGPFFAFIILSLIALLFSKALKSKSYHFGHLLLLMTLFNIVITYGLFRYAGIGGNLFLLFAVCIYFIFNATQGH
jgi:oligosaccharide repeat unit polymerase